MRPNSKKSKQGKKVTNSEAPVSSRGCSRAFIVSVLEQVLDYVSGLPHSPDSYSAALVMSWLDEAKRRCLVGQVVSNLGGTEFYVQDPKTYWTDPQQYHTWWKNNIERKAKYQTLQRDAVAYVTNEKSRQRAFYAAYVLALSTNIKHHFEKERVLHGGNLYPGPQSALPVWEDYLHTGYPGLANREIYQHYGHSNGSSNTCSFRPSSNSSQVSYGAPSMPPHGGHVGYNHPYAQPSGLELDHPSEYGPPSSHLCSRSSFTPSPSSFSNMMGMSVRHDYAGLRPSPPPGLESMNNPNVRSASPSFGYPGERMSPQMHMAISAQQQELFNAMMRGSFYQPHHGVSPSSFECYNGSGSEQRSEHYVPSRSHSPPHLSHFPSHASSHHDYHTHIDDHSHLNDMCEDPGVRYFVPVKFEDSDKRRVTFSSDTCVEMNQCESEPTPADSSYNSTSSAESVQDSDRHLGGLKGGGSDDEAMALCGDHPDSLLFESFHSDFDSDGDSALGEEMFTRMINAVDFDCLESSPTSEYSDGTLLSSGKPFHDDGNDDGDDDAFIDANVLFSPIAESVCDIENFDDAHVPIPCVSLPTTFASLAAESPLCFRAVSPQTSVCSLSVAKPLVQYKSVLTATPHSEKTEHRDNPGEDTCPVSDDIGSSDESVESTRVATEGANVNGIGIKSTKSGRQKAVVRTNPSCTLPPFGMNSCGSVTEMKSAHRSERYSHDSKFSSDSDSDDDNGLLKSSLSYEELTASPLLIHSPRPLSYKKKAQVAVVAATKSHGRNRATKFKMKSNDASQRATVSSESLLVSGRSNEDMLRMFDRSRCPKSPPGGGHFDFEDELEMARVDSLNEAQSMRQSDRPFKRCCAMSHAESMSPTTIDRFTSLDLSPRSSFTSPTMSPLQFCKNHQVLNTDVSADSTIDSGTGTAISAGGKVCVFAGADEEAESSVTDSAQELKEMETLIQSRRADVKTLQAPQCNHLSKSSAVDYQYSSEPLFRALGDYEAWGVPIDLPKQSEMENWVPSHLLDDVVITFEA